MMDLSDLYYFIGSGGGAVDVTVEAGTPESEAVAYGPAAPVDVAIPAGTAISGPRVRGPLFAEVAGTLHPPISIHLVRRNDLRTSVLEFDQSLKRQLYVQLNEAGSGSVTVLNDDPDLASLVGDGSDLLQFRINGQAALTAMVNEVQRVSLDEGEEAAEKTTLGGPGHLAVLEEAVVYPALGVGKLPIEDDRLFSWPSVDYDDSAWLTSHGQARADADTGYWSTSNLSKDWPDGGAEWMWAPGSDGFWALPGPCYFRKTVTVPEGVDKLVVHASFDDYGTLYFDGMQVLDGEFGDNPAITGKSTDGINDYKVQIDVTPGVHTIAIKGENGLDPEGDTSDNPGAMLVTVLGMTPGGALTEPLMHSDSTWKCLPYPASPPGMTPGEAIRHCVEEAQARGAIPEVTLGFTDDIDSGGNPWPIVGDISTKVGTDLLTFLREISDTYLSFRMQPTTWVLETFVKGLEGDSTSVQLIPAEEDDPATGNLTGLSHNRQLAETSSLLVRWGKGWREVAQAAGIRREGLLGLGSASSEPEVDRVSRQQLVYYANPRTAIEASVDPNGSGDVPFIDFSVGDSLLVPDHAGILAREQVIGLHVEEDEDGYVTFGPELKDVILNESERFEQSLKKMANGTMRGTSSVATPTSSVGSAFNAPQAAVAAAAASKPQASAAVLGEALDRWSTDFIPPPSSYWQSPESEADLHISSTGSIRVSRPCVIAVTMEAVLALDAEDAGYFLAGFYISPAGESDAEIDGGALATTRYYDGPWTWDSFAGGYTDTQSQLFTHRVFNVTNASTDGPVVITPFLRQTVYDFGLVSWKLTVEVLEPASVHTFE